MADFGAFGNVVGSASVKLSLDAAEFDAQLAAAKAKLEALGSSVDGAGGTLGGLTAGRAGGAGLTLLGGLTIANQILPITTMVAALAVAAVSLAAVAAGFIAVGAGALYFSSGADSVTAKMNSMDKAVYGVANQLGVLGSKLRDAFSSSGATSGLTTDISIFVNQAGAMLQGFVAHLSGLGSNLAKAFLAPGSGGLSIFQQWGQIINQFLSTAGGGLLHLFVSLQAPAQALVTGLGSVISAFGKSAVFNSGLVNLTTTTIQKFFAVLVELVPILEKFSTTMDSVGITLLDFIHNLMPAISAAFSIFGTVEKVVAGVVAVVGAFFAWVLRLKGLGPVVQFILGLAGAFLVLAKTVATFSALSFTGALSMMWTGVQGLTTFLLGSTIPALGVYAAAFIAVGVAIKSVMGLMNEFAQGQQTLLSDFQNSSKSFAALQAVYQQQKSNLEARNSFGNQFFHPTDALAAVGVLHSLNAAWAQYVAGIKAAQAATNAWDAQVLQATQTEHGLIIATVLGGRLTQSQASGLATFLHATGSSFTALRLQFQQDSLNMATSAKNVQSQLTAFGQSWLTLRDNVAAAFNAMTVTATTGFNQFSRQLKTQHQTMLQWGKAQSEILQKVGDSAKPFLAWAAAQGPAALKLLQQAAGKSSGQLQVMIDKFNRNQTQSQNFANTVMGKVVGALTDLTKSFFTLALQMHAITWAQYQADIANLGAAANSAAGGFNNLAAAALRAANAIAKAGLPGHGVGGVTGGVVRGTGGGAPLNTGGSTSSITRSATVNVHVYGISDATGVGQEVRRQLALEGVLG